MINLDEVAGIIKEKGRYWVAFSGDSITSCEWVHPNWREIVEYVLKNSLIDHLKGDWKTAEWMLRFFNFGYDGATTSDILSNLEDQLLIGPDLYVLTIGGNDPVMQISTDKHSENILDIKKRVEKSGSKFVFITDNNPWNDTARSKYEPYIEIDKNIGLDAHEFINLFEISGKFPYERIYTFRSEQNPVEGIKEGDLDYWHPNQLGNAYIAKAILKEIFDIDFDPERYWKDTLAGEKSPKY